MILFERRSLTDAVSDSSAGNKLHLDGMNSQVSHSCLLLKLLRPAERRWSYADLLASLMRVAEAGSAEREASLPLRLRRGLPFNFLATHGLQARLLSAPAAAVTQDRLHGCNHSHKRC